MAKGGKFAALAEFRQQPEPEPEAAESVEAPAEVPTPAEPEAPALEPEPAEAADERVEESPGRPTTATARPRGRPPGKRSDPEWKLFSHFLKRTTQRQAAAILFEADDGRDLSDVLQTLLEKWVARQRAKS